MKQKTTRQRIRCIAVLLMLALLTSLLAACGGKQEAAASGAPTQPIEAPAGSGASTEPGRPGAAEPGATEQAEPGRTEPSEPEQSEPAAPEPTESAGRTDLLYYAKRWADSENGERRLEGSLYYRSAPDAEPIWIDDSGYDGLDINSYETHVVSQKMHDFSLQRSDDGKILCIVSSLEDSHRYRVEEKVQTQYGVEALRERCYGKGYTLSVLRNGTELTRIASLAAAHGMTADGSLIYYLQRPAADRVTGPKTLKVFDVAAGTSAELDAGVTYLYVFPSGGAVWRMADGTLRFRKDGEVRTIGSLPGNWESGSGQSDPYAFGSCDGEWECAAFPDGSVLWVLDPEAHILYMITEDGLLRTLDEGVYDIGGLCGDGSAWYVKEQGISRWDGEQSTEIWTGDLKARSFLTAGTKRPILAMKSETELVLLSGETVRTFPQEKLLGAQLSPDEDLLYFWAGENRRDCSLYSVAPDAGEPALCEEHVGFGSDESGLCFLDGQPLYVKNLKYVYRDDLVGDLFCGGTPVSSCVLIGVELQRTSRMGWMTAMHGAFYYMEFIVEEDTYMGYRIKRFDGTDSEVVLESAFGQKDEDTESDQPYSIKLICNDGRGGAFLYRDPTREHMTMGKHEYLHCSDSGMQTVAVDLYGFYLLNWYGE